MSLTIKCGVCGSYCYSSASVNETGCLEILATCPGCIRLDKEVGELEDRIYYLEREKHENHTQ